MLIDANLCGCVSVAQTMYPSGSEGWGPVYSNWEANTTSTCICDPGRSGRALHRLKYGELERQPGMRRRSWC